MEFNTKKCLICQTKISNNRKYCSNACNNKAYRLRHPERHKKVKKKYRANNKEKVLEQRRNWYAANKEKMAEYRQKMSDYHREYWKKRRKVDSMFRIKNNMRNKLNSLCKGNRSSLLKLLGCTYEEFKRHMESKFIRGMSWENYGKYGWHVDHIKPLSAFDLSKGDELKKAWHYTNLQPLWAEDNLSKGTKYE